MLQHNTELDGRAPAQVHEFGGTLRRNLNWLLQQNVFARGSGLAHEVKVRVGRCEDENGVDRPIGQDGLEPVTRGKREASGKFRATLFARTERSRDLQTIAQVEHALGMRGRRHAESDDSQSMPHHCLSASGEHAGDHIVTEGRN
jgi:hypothetical protein